MGNVVEIVEFKIDEKIKQKDFLKIVDDLENNFHSKENGFISTDLLKSKNENEYTMIQHWKSLRNCKDAAKKMMKDPKTINFRNAIEPKSVNMSFYNTIKSY
ncbi:MAG: antibiotic biosynthesis monooxygenase [Bacillota bacterium]